MQHHRQFHNHAVFISRFIIPLLVAATMPIVTPAPAADEALDARGKTPIQILILNSHDYDMPWQRIVNDAIAAEFDAQSRMTVKPHTEYTGLSQHDDNTYVQKLIELYRHKFKTKTFDLIIAVDTRATNFMIDHGEGLFPGCPIVSINDSDNMARMQSRPNMTGVLSTINVNGTLDVMLRLHPGTRHIALIAGISKMDRSLEIHARSVLEAYEHRLKVIDLTGLPMATLLAEVGRLPENTLGLYLLTLVDGAGESFIPKNILPRISEASSAPLYGLYDALLGSGIVGGYLSSAAVEGKLAAETALRIVAGEKPADIPIVRDSHAIMFDWRQLKRWNIPERNLPAGSLVRYKPRSFWGQYKGRIIGVLGLIVIEGTLIVILMLQLARRRIAERALKESEERYRSLFENNHAVMLVIDPQTGDIMDANPAAASYYGWPQEALTAMNIMDLNVLTKAQLFLELEKARAGGKNSFTFRHRLSSGEIRDVDVFSGPIRVNDQQALYSIVHDVTDRKKAQAALQESENRLKSIMDSINSGIVVIDIHTHEIVDVNLTAEHMIGAPKQQIVGSPCYQYFNAGQEGPCPITDLQQGMDNREQILRRLDGAEIPILKTVTRIQIKGREFLLGSFIDITEQKRLEAQLLQTQKMESIGNLAGGIAHDFNNLLYPVIGYSELLLEDLSSGSHEYEYAGEILKAAKRGSGLVKQILAFSRQSEHKMIPVRVQQILKEVLTLSRSTLPTSIEITHDIQPDCGLVKADPVQLHQIAMNLITNAYHAMEETEGKLTVTLREVELHPDETTGESLASGGYAMLSVSDTGCGIAPDVIDKIFEPYFTTKAQGKGTGLGLAVVHGIVKDHNGNIEVYSDVGTGTTFNVYLPLMERVVEAPSVTHTVNVNVGKERILLVDDEEMVARLQKQMLERLGYRITLNTSSVDALEVFRANPDAFDLVISDMTMPNMTGDKLANALLSIRPEIPIIVCTGFSERINKETAEAFGIKGVLMKPVVKSEIAQMVRGVLDEAADRTHG